MPSTNHHNTADPFWEFIASLEEASSDAAGAPLAGLFEPRDSFCGAKYAWGLSNTSDTDFSPAADVFNMATSYVIHVSLPGVKKGDIGVNYDEEKSEIQVSGVVHRNGDEEFLKTLAVGERNVGVFEKRIKLGSLRSPASVDPDGITASLEDGVLEVIVPKKEKETVEKWKVQID